MGQLRALQSGLADPPPRPRRQAPARDIFPGHSTGPGSSISRQPPQILNATPQHEIDQLWPLGQARGVVLHARRDETAGERALRTKVFVEVCGRLPGGGFTDRAALTVWVHWRLAEHLRPGLEVPVEVDPSSARVTGVHTRRLAEELGGPARTTSTPPSQRAGQRPIGDDDPLLEPVEGVSFARLVAIHLAMTTQPLPPGGLDELAESHGVPRGRWEEVDRRWRERIIGSPPLARRFAAAIDEGRRSPG
jgi:hypothetical protein